MMKACMKMLAFACILAGELVSLPAVNQSENTLFVAQAVDRKPVPSSVAINGKNILPAPGSAAGVWFYHDGAKGAQLLLTGQAAVSFSWRVTASLNAGDEVRICFDPGDSPLTNIQFHADSLSPVALTCSASINTLKFKAESDPGAVCLTRIMENNDPVFFAPVRRPFSRQPAMPSPDMHQAIANALVEWDWQMQDGIQTPREVRTFRQASHKLMGQMEALMADRSKSLAAADVAAWDKVHEAWVKDNNSPVPGDSGESLWLDLHRFRRKISLDNPLFKGTPLIFVKHVPSVMSHQLTQVYGYCSRPGGGLYVLPQPGVAMRTRDITPPNLTAGNFMTPELSYDAQKLLFAYCPVKEAPSSWNFDEKTSRLRYHIYELALESGAVRTLTQGDTDNFFPVNLPSGEILYVSTQRGGYHRCGRGPCFVYTLSRMGEGGQYPHSVSFHETHEWDPCLLNDGRVIYTRWDYVDRNAVHYEQLWSARPDGSNVRIYYGNNTWNPVGVWEARAIPGSPRIMATASPHHGMSAGSVVLLDTSKGVDGKEPLTRLTPDVRFPESESPLAFGPSATSFDFDTPVATYWNSPFKEAWMEKTPTEGELRWPGHCYKSPWPLSEKYFIVSYSFDQLVGEPGPNIPNMFGIYLADSFGNKELVYRDPAISSLWARPLARRTPPPDVSTTVIAGSKEIGTFFLSDVMESWPHIPANSPVAYLRIIQVLLKTTPNADSPKVGAAFAAPGKQVLGIVPVEADGSAFFEVPAKTPVLFQALDAKGRALQTMRSLVYLQPGEHESCIGCHEHRMKQASPHVQALALQRAPSRIKPGPEGSRPFSFPLLVQPVLDRHCIPCHDGKEPKRPILTGEPEGDFTKSYNALASRVSFSAWNRPDQNFEPITEPMRFGALGSPLVKMLEQGHNKVELTPEEWARLYTWIDANALFYGTFDVNEQRKQLAGQRIEGPKE